MRTFSQHKEKLKRVAAAKRAEAGRQASAPLWLPPPSPEWVVARQAFQAMVDDSRYDPEAARLYSVPPLHVFYTDPSRELLHNWIRIRPWCLQQIFNPPKHGKVLMTKTQWKIALQGKYYAVDYSGCRRDPESPLCDIKRLPIAPSPSKRPRIEPGGSVQGANSRRPYADHRMSDRVDINVRFGVYAGFLPYNREERFKWGGTSVDYNTIVSNNDIAVHVLWELSVLNFRFELLMLDRIEAPHRYGTTAAQVQRESLVVEVWGGGDILPHLDDAFVSVSRSERRSQ
ncbi:hypothetical protein A0H81_14715 [Grifola frondosa]|uniref:Uncharacterized protein n=1 Tax=Grifola frondosa TaxID=5627 RepID=A0A1C7LKE4_GRIFR|nr:hypothetical protein A0H81_14715 [Grifola frondosa]